MNYVTFAIAIFILIFAFIFINASQIPETVQKPEVQQEAVKFCEEVPDSQAISFQAPEDNNTKCPGGPGGSYKSGGVDPDNLFGGNTTYKLIRKNVPLNRSFFTKEDGSDHSTLASSVGINPNLDTNKYRLYFPQITGEIILDKAPYSRTRDCGDRSYENTGRMYFIDYGLAFGLVLRNGQPIEISGTSIKGGSGVFWLTDVFKDVKRDPIPADSGAFQCADGSGGNITNQPQQTVTIPNQSFPANNKQLQLSYFVFDKPSVGGVTNGWVDTCKPAVYLYPPKQEIVNVKVKPDGYLTYTNPLYNPALGWNVLASPDGVLTESNNINLKTFDYLYYESRIFDSSIRIPEEGYVVSSDKLDDLYKDILPKLGLNSRQQKDYTDYWDKALPKSPYYFVGIMDKEQINRLEPLAINPVPDYINRVRLYYKALETPIQVKTPEITNRRPLDSKNFNVVEWGGMVKADKNHPFTCSQ